MRTDPTERRPDDEGATWAATAFEALIHSKWSPLVMIPVFLGAFILADMLIDTLGSERLPSSVDLFHHTTRISWERLLVLGLLVLVGIAWHFGVKERQRRLRAIETYQRQLHDLMTQLAVGEAEERRQLAERLHEGVSQQITAARLFLSTADERDSGEGEDVRSAAKILDHAIAGCREVAEMLSPPVLHEFGLASAIEALALRTSRRTGIGVEVEARDDLPSLDCDVLRVMFQVLAEVLELAVTDPSCHHVRIRCTSGNNSVTVDVAWDAPTKHDLFSARERLRGLRGRLSSEMSRVGTTIRVSVPALDS